MDLYSQPTYPNMIKVYIKQKFIHWATRGRLNNHCKNQALLGMKLRRMATGFLYNSASLARLGKENQRNGGDGRIGRNS